MSQHSVRVVLSRIMFATLLGIIVIFAAARGQTKECTQESVMMKSNTLQLKKDLLCGYDRTVRPVVHHSNKTTVYVSLSPKYFYMDEGYHSLGISCMLTLKWTDEFLKWNPAHYDGLNDFFFDSNTIWVPDISTTANPNRKYSGALVEVGVSSSGEAIMVQNQYFSGPCDLDYTLWPYDYQYCKLSLRTTSYYRPYLDLQIVRNSDEELKKLYQIKGPWVLKSMNSIRHYSQMYQYQDVYVVTISYTFIIQRHASLYYSAIITAALVLPLLVLCAFWLEPGCGSRLNLCIAVLISHLFHLEQLTLATHANGDSKPIIVIYCQWCVFLAAMGLIFTIACRVISDLSTGPYLLHQLSSWICSNRYAQSLLLIDVDLKNDAGEGSEDESSLVIRNGRFYQQWRVLATFIDRVLFITYFVFYIFLYKKYFPN